MRGKMEREKKQNKKQNKKKTKKKNKQKKGGEGAGGSRYLSIISTVYIITLGEVDHLLQ
jgi:hypothetical protein